MSASVIARLYLSHPFISILSSYKTLFILCSFITLCAAPGLTANAATLSVPAGGDLQGTLDAALPGDTILLDAGATYAGSYRLPNKAGEGWITVTSVAAQNLATGERVTPAAAALMPKLAAIGDGSAVLRTQSGAHHFRFIGIEFKPVNANALVFDLIKLGDGGSGQYAVEQIPHHLVFDRCYFHGETAGTLKRGIALNSAHTEIINSYFAEFKSKSQDAQAIAGWNGSGPYRIENNHLEASGYPVIFGGADVSVAGLVPSDITVRRNTFTRPLTWRNSDYIVKNLFELKSARRVEISGNVFENNWLHAQVGYAILFTVRGEDGRVPWAVIEDVDFVNNIVRHTGSAISIYGEEAQGARRIRIRNNLFEDVNSQMWGGGGNFMMIGKGEDITVNHNTIFHDGNIITAHSTPSEGFVFTDNIASLNQYGIFGVGSGPGSNSINTYFPNSVVRHNLLGGDRAWQYPSGNFSPKLIDDALFVDRARGDYRLQENSPYKNAGSDGKDLGCDFAELAVASKDRGTAAPSSPSPATLQHVIAAHTNAAALAAGTDVLSSVQLDSLIDEILQANRTAQSEAGLLGGNADEVETRLTVALYFTRAAQSLALVGASASSVRTRLQIAAEHLNRVREALQPANTNATSNSVSANILAMPSISVADARSSATLAAIVAPASAATIMLDSIVTSLGAGRVPSSSRSSVYELAGISVSVGGRAATLVEVSQARIGFVVPREAASGEAEVVVTTQSGTIARGTVTIAGIAPGIFVKSIGGVGMPLGKAGFTRGGFFRTTTMDASINEAAKLVITATGFSFATPNTNLANDRRTTAGMMPNLAESVAVEARARDGRTWWLTVDFAGVSQAATGLDQVTVTLPPELRNVGTLELTLVIGGMRSNSAPLNFRQPIVPIETTDGTTIGIKVGKK